MFHLFLLINNSYTAPVLRRRTEYSHVMLLLFTYNAFDTPISILLLIMQMFIASIFNRFSTSVKFHCITSTGNKLCCPACQRPAISSTDSCLPICICKVTRYDLVFWRLIYNLALSINQWYLVSRPTAIFFCFSFNDKGLFTCVTCRIALV